MIEYVGIGVVIGVLTAKVMDSFKNNSQIQNVGNSLCGVQVGGDYDGVWKC